MIGRATELSVLRRAVWQLRAGAGAHLHIAGEAGIGKSLLIDSAARRLVGSGLVVRRAVADETDRRRPLAVAGDLLDVELRTVADALGAAITAAEELQRTGHVVLLADDVHWADDDSLDVLRALARRAPGAGYVLVTAARHHPAPSGVRHLEAAARAAATLLELASLDEREVKEMAVDRLGATPGPRLSAFLADAGGNPLLIDEVLAGVAAEGMLGSAGAGIVDLAPGAPLPDGVATSVVAHLRFAAPDDEPFLLPAAVLPVGFSPDELAALTARPVHEVVSALLRLIAAGVLVDRPPGMAFRHDLLRHAVTTTAPGSVVGALRRAAADVLLEQRATPERLATALLAAVDPDDPGQSDHLANAARAMSARNPLAAADLLGRALSGVPRGDPRERPLTVELGWMLIAAGRAGEVPELVGERIPSSPTSSVSGAEDVDIDRVVGHALAVSGRIGDIQQRFATRTVEGIVAEGDPNDAAYVDAVAELAQLRVSLGDTSAARELLAWVAASPTSASIDRRVAVDTAQSYLHGINGEFAESVACGERARSAAAADPEGLVPAVSATLSMALSLDLGGDADRALALLRRPELPGPNARWAPPLLQFATALTRYRQGAWDDALTEAGAGLVAAEEVDLGLGVFWPYALNALIHHARGDTATAESWLARASELGGQRALGVEWLMFATAAIQFDRGDVGGAAATMEAVALGVLATGAPALLLSSGPLCVLSFLATGRDELALRVVDELAAMCTRTRSPVVAGVAAWTAGLRTEDVAALTAAVVTLESAGRRADAALAAHDAAVTALRGGAPGDARAHATRAFAGFDELGADHWHRRLRAELRTYGLSMRPRRAPRRDRFGWGAITPSERAVVDLVAGGLTNTEIGEQLFVSRRTVESHLVRIFAKLGCANRGQLAAAARAAQH